MGIFLQNTNYQTVRKMIRHIVMFKFRKMDDRENFERIRIEMKEKLDALPQVIKEIKTFETGINVNPIPRAWDLVLVSEFESMEDLEKYRVHPVHLPYHE